jgi:hypothetical protein
MTVANLRVGVIADVGIADAAEVERGIAKADEGFQLSSAHRGHRIVWRSLAPCHCEARQLGQ